MSLGRCIDAGAARGLFRWRRYWSVPLSFGGAVCDVRAHRYIAQIDAVLVIAQVSQASTAGNR